jgi:hypothetical protein
MNGRSSRLTPWRERLRVPLDWRERLRFHAPDALAWRLLLLTFVFTAAVEVLIVAPSAASFHERWLLDRLQSAELASVGVEALPYSAVEDDTAEQLLRIGGCRRWWSATRACVACCCRRPTCRARPT